MQFKDHFSGHAGRYAQYRPDYPDELYREIYRYVQHFDHAWDVGTGNGQVALKLAERFAQVIATDASANQIEHAQPHPKVQYLVCKAEHSLLEGDHFDLVTVGQALHWFDFERFFSEVRRVIKPNGIFACWTYRFLKVTPAIDRILSRFFTLIEPYWPPERDYVEARYETIPFPEYFLALEVNEIAIRREMDAAAVLGYLSTWSSAKNYRLEHDSDPLDSIRTQFMEAWGDPDGLRTVTHPTVLKVFSVGR